MPIRNEYSLTRNRWDASVSPRIDRAQIFDDNQVISIVNASESFLFDLANIRIGQTIKFDMDREVALAATIQLDPPLLEGLPIGGSFSFHRDENGIKFIPGTFPVPKPDNHHGFVPLDEEPKEDPDDPYGLVGWRDEYLAIDDEEPLIDNPAEDYLGFTENIDDLTPPTVNVVYDQITRGFFGCDHLIKLGTTIVLCSALDKEVIVQLPEAPNGTRIAVKKEDLSLNQVLVLDSSSNLVATLDYHTYAIEFISHNGEWQEVLAATRPIEPEPPIPPDPPEPPEEEIIPFDFALVRQFMSIDEEEEWPIGYFSLDDEELDPGIGAAAQFLWQEEEAQDDIRMATPDPITMAYAGADVVVYPGENIILCDASTGSMSVKLYDAASYNVNERIVIKKEDLSLNSVYVLDNMGDLVVELYVPQHSAELAAVNGEWIVILSLCPDTIKPNVFDLGNLNYFIALDESEESGDWRDEYLSLDEDEPYAGMAAAMQYFCHDDDEQDYTL